MGRSERFGTRNCLERVHGRVRRAAVGFTRGIASAASLASHHQGLRWFVQNRRGCGLRGPSPHDQMGAPNHRSASGRLAPEILGFVWRCAGMAKVRITMIGSGAAFSVTPHFQCSGIRRLGLLLGARAIELEAAPAVPLRPAKESRSASLRRWHRAEKSPSFRTG